MIKSILILTSMGLFVWAIHQHLNSVELEYTSLLLNNSEQQDFSHQFNTFTLTNTNSSGEIQSIIHSPTTRMLNAEQITLMDNPKFIMHRKNETPIVITAKQAKVLHAYNQTSLQDNVKVVMNEENQNDIVMTTEQLTIDNKTQQAKTDLPATLTHAKGNMHGTGVEFNPNNKQIKFLSKVRGIYEH